MSKIKNGGLDQYGAKPFQRQQFETAGVEGVNTTNKWEKFTQYQGNRVSYNVACCFTMRDNSPADTSYQAVGVIGNSAHELFYHSAPCGLLGCKNRAHSVSWPEVVKGAPNHCVDCFVSYIGQFFFCFLFCVSAVCSVVFDCFWLPVPVQLIAWKDSSPKSPIICRVGR